MSWDEDDVDYDFGDTEKEKEVKKAIEVKKEDDDLEDWEKDDFDFGSDEKKEVKGSDGVREVEKVEVKKEDKSVVTSSSDALVVHPDQNVLSAILINYELDGSSEVGDKKIAEKTIESYRKEKSIEVETRQIEVILDLGKVDEGKIKFNKDTHPFTEVLELYSDLRFQYGHIIKQFGRDICLIHGDSLMFACMESSYLGSKQDGWKFDTDAQTLPVIYLFENFLKNLSNRGMKFKILFSTFPSGSGWLNSGNVMLECLKCHIFNVNFPYHDIVVTKADIEEGGGLRGFIELFSPAYVMIKTDWSPEVLENGLGDVMEALVPQQTMLLSLRIMTTRNNIILLSGQQDVQMSFISSEVKAFFMQTAMSDQVIKVHDNIEKKLQSAAKADVSLISEKALEIMKNEMTGNLSLFNEGGENDIGHRGLITFSALKSFMSSNSSVDMNMVKAYLTHVVLLHYLPIQLRAQKETRGSLNEAGMTKISTFVKSFSPYLSKSFSLYVSNNMDRSSSMATSNSCDIFDIFFLQSMLTKKSNHKSLSTWLGASSSLKSNEISEKITLFWKLLGLDDKMWSEDYFPCTSKAVNDEFKVQSEPKITYISNDFVDGVLGSTFRDKYKSFESNLTEGKERVGLGGNITHYHSDRKLIDMDNPFLKNSSSSTSGIPTNSRITKLDNTKEKELEKIKKAYKDGHLNKAEMFSATRDLEKRMSKTKSRVSAQSEVRVFSNSVVGAAAKYAFNSRPINVEPKFVLPEAWQIYVNELENDGSGGNINSDLSYFKKNRNFKHVEKKLRDNDQALSTKRKSQTEYEITKQEIFKEAKIEWQNAKILSLGGGKLSSDEEHKKLMVTVLDSIENLTALVADMVKFIAENSRSTELEMYSKGIDSYVVDLYESILETLKFKHLLLIPVESWKLVTDAETKRIKAIMRGLSKNLNQAAAPIWILYHIFQLLHLQEAADAIHEIATASTTAGTAPKGAFPLITPGQSQSISGSYGDILTKSAVVDLNSGDIQLRFMGPLLPRPVEDEDDPRIDPRWGFRPDRWQITLMDAVDERRSGLVCAPTSSGKSFIALYAMERLLRSTDDGVIIYVVPTKALCQQVLKDTVNTFSKDFGNDTTKNLVGIFNREVSENLANCQILITVPQCLEIILMKETVLDVSGLKNEEIKKIKWWHRKLSYIILDEVHNMGNDPVWERILQMTPVPFLALSATIGNPEPMNQWLNSIETNQKVTEATSKKPQCELIKHSIRFNDIVPYTYIPKKLMPKNSSLSKQFLPLHPLGALNVQEVKRIGISDSIRLIPEQCAVLLEVFRLEKLREWLENKKKLNPTDVALASLLENYAALQTSEYAELNNPLRLMSVKESYTYDNKLKDFMKDLIHYDETLSLRIIEKLGKKQRDTMCIIDEEIVSSSGDATNGQQFKFIENNLYDLVQSLADANLLPALLFHMNQRGIEKLATSLEEEYARLEKLHREETRWFEKQKKHLSEKKLQLEAKKSELKSTKKGTEEEGKLNEDLININGEILKTADELENPPPLPQFTVCKRVIPASELGDLLHDMDCKTQADVNMNPLYKALQRGIGIHHAGVDRNMRRCVEKLFLENKNKSSSKSTEGDEKAAQMKLGVVLATGTLAQGINMPTRSTVMLGDSIFLHAENYLQWSGRSGRRGYDKRGHTVFYGVPYSKVRRLLSCRPPEIYSATSITPSCLIRLLIWYHRAKQSVQANRGKAVIEKNASMRVQNSIDTCKRFISSPFISFLCSPEDKDCLYQLRATHFMFALSFLVKEGHVNKEGLPCDLAGLAARIHFCSPYNFVFADMLVGTDAVLPEFIAQELKALSKFKTLHSSQILTMDIKVLQVLAFMFYRISIRSNDYRREGDINRIRLNFSDLPTTIRERIGSYDKRVLSQYINHLKVFVDVNKSWLHPEALPGSGLIFNSIWNPDYIVDKVVKEKDAGVLGQLASQSRKFSVRSSFLACAGALGHDDNGFESLRDVQESARSRLEVDIESIPTIDHIPSAINAYICDYYRNGQYYTMLDQNHLSDRIAYDSLDDFLLVLKTISNSLETHDSNWFVTRYLKGLSNRFALKFKQSFSNGRKSEKKA